MIGEVQTTPSIRPATRNTAVRPGDILLHVHEFSGGEFHAAAVIAKDGGDVVTLEADASGASPIEAAEPIFDMYQGPVCNARSFEQIQRDRGGVEKTYVISFLVAAGRSTADDTLWSGIEKFGLGTSAKETVDQIKDSIQAALLARATQSGSGPMRRRRQTKPKPYYWNEMPRRLRQTDEPAPTPDSRSEGGRAGLGGHGLRARPQ